jgi:uncharacterized membrane protein
MKVMCNVVILIFANDSFSNSVAYFQATIGLAVMMCDKYSSLFSVSDYYFTVNILLLFKRSLFCKINIAKIGTANSS